MKIKSLFFILCISAFLPSYGFASVPYPDGQTYRPTEIYETLKNNTSPNLIWHNEASFNQIKQVMNYVKGIVDSILILQHLELLAPKICADSIDVTSSETSSQKSVILFDSFLTEIERIGVENYDDTASGSAALVYQFLLNKYSCDNQS